MLAGGSTRINAGRLAVMSALLVVVAISIMTPRLLSSEFGLLDDGVAIHVSQLVTASVAGGDLTLLLGLEAHRGRFRPLYWLYGALQYAIWGASPLGFFSVNALTLVLTALSVAGTVAFATKDGLASVAAGLAYLLSPPVIESYYTLWKPEVPLALWLAVSLCCWAGARAERERDPRRSRWLFTASALSLLFAYFTKETAQAMLIVSTLWVLAPWGRSGHAPPQGLGRLDRWYLGVNLACTAFFWLARGLARTATIAAGEDSRHYALTGHAIVSGMLGHIAWYLRDFPLLVPLLLFLWWSAEHHRSRDRWPILVPIFWITAWTLIMLPWHSLLEYYLLPACVGGAVITGIGAASVVRSLRAPARSTRVVAGALVAAASVLLPLTVGNAVTSGRVQLAIDTANARLVTFLATEVPPQGTVLVNIPPPNEYVLELATHLAILKDRSDVSVEYAGRGDLQRSDGVLVATPIMRNQPSPSVRLAVYEAGAKSWRDELHARLGTQADLVYRETQRLRLGMAHTQRLLCPLLIWARAHHDLLCPSGPLILDAREFVYGWEVYQAHAL